MGSRIGGKMTSTVRVTPGISRYKVVWRVVKVSTELREIHEKFTALEARGQMLVFDVKQVRRKTLDGNYPHQFFSN